MFFDDPAQILSIAAGENVSIFTAEPNANDFRPFLTITPGKTGKITIEQAREMIAATQTKQTHDQFILIKNAETIDPAAENAILKLLEEPGEHYHFILTTKEPHMLLPTILSRAKLYILKTPNPLSTPPATTPEIINLAKRLLAATGKDLPPLADEISKQKDGAREYALKITATAIELAYKSYFATEKPVFLKKLPHLLRLYENLQANGHLKLHIVADML